MRADVIWSLILKDWRLQRHLMILSILAGVIALAVLQMQGQTPRVIGAVFFFMALMFCASLVPVSNIVNERKKQTLPFLMSLPISASRYGAAKLLSTFGMFLVPWLMLVCAAFYMILGRHVLPNGTIPMMLILVNLPLIGFCLMAGTALLAESEGWANAAIGAVNSSYWLVWYLLVSQVPSIPGNWSGPVAVWSTAVVKILGVEFALVILILALTLYLQSRKRSFV